MRLLDDGDDNANANANAAHHHHHHHPPPPPPPNARIRRRRTNAAKLSDFTCIDETHPYGVLPGGNRFFGSRSSSSSSQQSSSTAANSSSPLPPSPPPPPPLIPPPPPVQVVLGDRAWQQILSFCDGPSLGRLVQTSRYHYAVGHQPELWRDLVLRYCDEQQQQQHSSRKITLKDNIMGPSWKDTYALLFVQNDGDANNDNNNNNHRVVVEPHCPMAVQGVYSDVIYQSHLCRSFAIPKAWLERQQEEPTMTAPSATTMWSDREVPKVRVEDLDPQTFFERYEEGNQPVVVVGAGQGRAVDEWNDPGYLLTHANAPDKSFRTTSGAAPLPGSFTLKAYQKYCQFDYLEESPLYLFDRTAFQTNPQWVDDFFPQFYANCPYWDPSGPYGHDLLQHLGADRRPDYEWMIQGPKRSGSVFHIDPNATHAYNACISGRKRWIFYPPGPPPPGIFPSADGDEVALPLSVGEWIMQFWSEHMNQYHERPVGQRPLECTTHPGDVVFVPHGWWHSVINLDDCNIAITHNYVSPSNLGNVLKFFREKQDQISGCRDRNESIKPEHLYDTFVKVLQEKETKRLQNALQQKVWTCAAWADDATKPEEAQVETKETSFQEDRNSDGNERGMSILAKTERIEAFSFSFLTS